MKKITLLSAFAAVILASCAGNPEGKKAETNDSVELVKQQPKERLLRSMPLPLKWFGQAPKSLASILEQLISNQVLLWLMKELSLVGNSSSI